MARSAIIEIQHYRYARPSSRIFQTCSPQQARYLPGLEIYGAPGAIDPTASLRFITGHSVRILQRVSGIQPRFSSADRNQSVMLELSRAGRILSREAYYPFGGTALWACDKQNRHRKTLRYSGKQRDASGLIFYGWRYYAPWLMRWLNPDPAQTVDGLNLYLMVGNNPATQRDIDGRMKNQHDNPQAGCSGEQGNKRLKTTDQPKVEPPVRQLSISLPQHSPLTDANALSLPDTPADHMIVLPKTLTELPNEMLHRIYDYLPVSDIQRLSQTCQRLQQSTLTLNIAERHKTWQVVKFVRGITGHSNGVAAFQAAWFTHKDKTEPFLTQTIRQERVFEHAARKLFPQPFIEEANGQLILFYRQAGLCLLSADGKSLTPFCSFEERCRAKQLADLSLNREVEIYYDTQGIRLRPDVERLTL